MINSNWELHLQGPLVTIWIQTHTMQTFWQPIVEWSIYIEFAISLIKIWERSNEKVKTHCTVCLHYLLSTRDYEAKKLCCKSLDHLELANCYWDSLCPILGFSKFPQVVRFMLLGFSLLDPPSHVSNSSWSSGTGGWTLSVTDM